MSTKRHGNKIVSDLSRLILFAVKRSGGITVDGIVAILGDKFDEHTVRKRAYYLRYNKSLAGSASLGLSITSKGLTTLEQLEFKAIASPKIWDQKWRIVIYDIPETKRPARNKVRQLLKDLGFRQLQISAWTHPLPCLKQFHTIRKAYGIENHLLLLEVNHTKEFDKLKNIFSKQYPVLNRPR